MITDQEWFVQAFISARSLTGSLVGNSRSVEGQAGSGGTRRSGGGEQDHWDAGQGCLSRGGGKGSGG